MWNEYTKIDTVLQRDLEGTKRLIPGTFRDPAVQYLKDLPWEVTEKVDGTNVSIYWDGYRIEIHGRTKAAELPKELMEVLEAKFLNTETEELFEQMFPPKKDEAGNEKLVEATIFGEGIGPKIQKVGKLYGDEYRFLVFDIKVGGVFLEHSSEFYGQIVQAFDLETVPDLPDMTIEEAEAYVKMKPQSLVNPKAPMEGLVLRPKVRLYNAKGERVIVKVKCRDYEPYNEYAEKYAWIKRGRAVMYALDEAEDDSRCIVYVVHRCTISDIRDACNAKIDKVEKEGDSVILREIDTGTTFITANLDMISRYDKQKWDKVMAEQKEDPDDK